MADDSSNLKYIQEQTNASQKLPVIEFINKQVLGSTPCSDHQPCSWQVLSSTGLFFPHRFECPKTLILRQTFLVQSLTFVQNVKPLPKQPFLVLIVQNTGQSGYF